MSTESLLFPSIITLKYHHIEYSKYLFNEIQLQKIGFEVLLKRTLEKKSRKEMDTEGEQPQRELL